MATAPKKASSGSEDQYRELIHEVRNLAAAVALLHTIFVKRTVLYWMLGIETVVVAVALIVGGIFIGVENAHQNALVDKTVGSCDVRNQQTDATRLYLQRQVALSNESQAITAVFLSQLHLHFTPAQQKQIAKITLEQRQNLNDYLRSQPKDIDCSKYKGNG